ncbi:MAG: beta-galactosidase [Spirochaetes bacterium]|nr:beta-galactosidase [Spirochaetota bacterium]
MLICILEAALTAEEKPYRFWPEYKQTPIGECAEQKWTPADAVLPGWDFSLPTSVTVKSNSLLVFSRIFSLTKTPNLPPISMKANPVLSIWVPWKELEPEEDDYRFDLLKPIIDAAAAKGYGVEIRPLTAIAKNKNQKDVGAAPSYLSSKYSVTVLQEEKQGASIVNYDVTHPDFHRRYLKFVREFGRSGLPQNPTVKIIVVGYASPSFGDEGIGPKGMDPKDEPAHVKERLDAWAEACAGVTQKVMMCGVSEYGFSKGFGRRGGFVENYIYRIPDESIGQYIDENGYLCVDERAPMIDHGSANGEENEEYEEKYAGPKGQYGLTTESFPYRYFSSSLRMMQMRNNIVLLNPFSLIPELTAFVSLEMGRTVNDTADVWCFLRENRINAGTIEGKTWRSRAVSDEEKRSGVPCRNFERWLYQRDSAGYKTEAVLPIPMPIRQWMIQKGCDTDMIARAGEKIGFAVDDRFLPGTPQQVTFKITFYDRVKGTLTLVWRTASGEMKYPVIAAGDDVIRTATIHTTAVFNAKDISYDFEIHSPERVPVCMVRVVKSPGNP